MNDKAQAQSKVAPASESEQENQNPTQKSVVVKISPPKIETASFVCQGREHHLSVNRFSQKAAEVMAETQKAGGTSRSKRNRSPKDFEQLFREAQYRSPEGWCGLHAASLRKAMISACRTVDFKMVLAKLGIFVIADGYDAKDKTPLLRIWGAEPHLWTAPVRNATGVFDIRPRPRWNPGEWELRPRIRYDADMFTITDITNLIARVGFQVGVGEGRPDSKDSAGIEYGLFYVSQVGGAREAA